MQTVRQWSESDSSGLGLRSSHSVHGAGKVQIDGLAMEKDIERPTFSGSGSGSGSEDATPTELSGLDTIQRVVLAS